MPRKIGRLIEQISMLLAGGTFTFLIEDSDRRRVKSSTPTVTGNVHHAGYRKNLFLRNQTSRSRAPRSYRERVHNDIFIGSARDRESNLNETEVLYHVTRIAVGLFVKRTVAVAGVSNSLAFCLSIPCASTGQSCLCLSLFLSSYLLPVFILSLPLSSSFSLFLSRCLFYRRIISFRRCDP